MKTLFGMLLAAALLSSAAHADEPLVSHLQALVVTSTDDGAEQFTEADRASPGAVIEYRLSYQNTSDETLNGLVVSGPIPEGAAYLSGSSLTESAHQFQVSIDSGSTWHVEPLMRTITDTDGVTRQEAVPASEYTSVRWIVQQPLLAQSTQSYRYRVTVQGE